MKTTEKDILNLISKKDTMDKRDLSRLLDYYRVRVGIIRIILK